MTEDIATAATAAAASTRQQRDNNHNNKPQQLKQDAGAAAANAEMPENVRKIKEKLEAETGKKYRYRPAKMDLPGVGALLQQGAIKDRPKTWQQTVGSSILLTAAFCLTFVAYYHLVLSKPSNIPARGKYQRRTRPPPANSNNVQPQSMQQKPKLEAREPEEQEL